jgi:hypothetical protein
LRETLTNKVMKTFAELMVEAEGFQGKFTPTPDTKKQAIEVGKKVNPGRVVKKGGPLATRPASKGADIVRTKQGGTGKEAIGAPKKSGPGVPQSSPQGSGTKTYDRITPERKKGGPITRYNPPADEPQQKPTKPKKNKKNKGPSMMQRFGNFAKKGLNNTVGDGQPESSSGSINAPKRGVYNG